MKKLFLACIGCAGLFALLPEAVRAHGGQYRGPEDVVPPAPGGGRGAPGSGGGIGGPQTPGGHGPAVPSPATPGTAGGRGGARGGGPGTGPRGYALAPDLSTWEYWWEFNKDAYLNLKEAVHRGGVVSGGFEYWLGKDRHVDARDSVAPSEYDRIRGILPALKKALDGTTDADIVSACMVAMAKVGRDHPDFTLAEVFTPWLADDNQEIRETAALSLGIAGLVRHDQVARLAQLAGDTPEARVLVGGGRVDHRTRAFACYALGLLARAHADPQLKRDAFAALRPLVDDERVSNRDLKVAAVNAIGLLHVDADDAAGQALLGEALQCLEDYYGKDLGVGEQLLQAHVPTAIAKLLDAGGARDRAAADRYARMFHEDLAGRGAAWRRSSDIARSCALALGRLCSPVDDAASPDAAHCELLRRCWRQHKDAQTRCFAILALGQIGGAASREALLIEWRDARKSLEKPWVAMAMGVHAFARREADRKAERTHDPDAAFGRALEEALQEVKDPLAASAFAVGLGLCGYTPAADTMRRMLAENRRKSDLAGYLCIGLALMGDRAAVEDIREVVEQSVRQPELLQQAATALGKLGDKTAADRLRSLLVVDGRPNLAKLSAVASALGFIGDRRTIGPLVTMLEDSRLPGLSRAFAAVALGGVGDDDLLPWNSAIGADLNYRAAVETLTDGRAGILDIL